MDTVTFKKILMDLSLNVYNTVRLGFITQSTLNAFRDDIEHGEYNSLNLATGLQTKRILLVYTDNLNVGGADFVHIGDGKFIRKSISYKDYL